MSKQEMRFLRREIIADFLVEHTWKRKHGYKASFIMLRFWVRMAEQMAYEKELKAYS